MAIVVDFVHVLAYLCKSRMVFFDEGDPGAEAWVHEKARAVLAGQATRSPPTGVIEGACRHLVTDRMDLTGARWSLQVLEAVLKLRALHSNGDCPDYWQYHLVQQRWRTHKKRYIDGVVSRPAYETFSTDRQKCLRTGHPSGIL